LPSNCTVHYRLCSVLLLKVGKSTDTLFPHSEPTSQNAKLRVRPGGRGLAPPLLLYKLGGGGGVSPGFRVQVGVYASCDVGPGGGGRILIMIAGVPVLV
jgi:hypothetical protein